MDWLFPRGFKYPPDFHIPSLTGEPLFHVGPLSYTNAHLASVSNRLNEVVKVLTSVATVLLVLTVVTGFFGQNWKFIPYDSEPLFVASLIFMVAVAAGTALYFRRKGWL